MQIKRIHHVAYRCKDAKETVEFYQKFLGMKFILAISEDKVPSTKEPDPYMHVFLDAGQGNILAFFELTRAAPMSRDFNTPAWVQHIAFELPTLQDLEAARVKLLDAGIEVVGPTDHSIIRSIYFFDPNGHRVELTVDTSTPEMLARLDEVKWKMLDDWAENKGAVTQASWLHAKEWKTEN